MVRLPDDLIASIKAYTAARWLRGDHHYYAEQRGTTPEKARQDDRDGKSGECAASILLERKFRQHHEPDFGVYDVGKKSFAGDLGVGLHVKTTSRLIGGLPSWTFQRENHNGPGGTDTLFGKSQDELADEICVFVHLESELYGIVKAIGRMDSVLPMLRDPVLDKHKGKKMCLYFEDVKRLGSCVLAA